MAEYTKQKLSRLVKDNPFPVMSKDPQEKEKNSFGMKLAKHIYFKGIQEDVVSDRRAIASENRDYGANRQDINKFKGLLDAEIDKSGNTAYINIDWSIGVPGMKFVNTIIGDMINQDYKIQFNAIDKHSKAKLKQDRDKFFGELAARKDLEEMEAMSGLSLKRREKFQPMSEEEINIYMDLDYKQGIELGMEQIVDFELYNNDWEKKIKKRIIRDFVENNKGGCRLYFDRNNNIRLRYVDAPMNYYTSTTDEPDYSDVDYEAERRLMTIAELKSRDVNCEVTEEQWFKIAQSSSNKNNNPSWKFGETYNYSHMYDDSEYAYDDFRVEVLDFIVYTEDRVVWEEKDDRFGGRHLSKKSYGYKVKPRNTKNAELIEKDIQMSYEGIWVVESDIMIGYGRSKNILRPKPMNGDEISAKLIKRYVIFEPNLRNGTSKSIVDLMKPNLDTMQLLILRKRHLIAEMTPTGVAIDVAGITDAMSLLSEEDPMRIVKLYKQKGVLFFARTDVNGDPANGMPIVELNNPFAEQLVALDNAIINEIEHIRANTGINDVRDGSSPDKDALVGIEKMRLLASNNTTREIYKGYLDGVFAQVGTVMARMIQYKVEYGNGIKEYENIIGEIGVKSVEFAKDITMAQLGVKIEALPTDDQIQELLNMLNISLQAGEIRPEDYLEVKRVMNIKKAERLLIYRRKKYAEEKMAEFQQKEQITAEREKASAMAAAEAEKIKNQSEAEAEIIKLREQLKLNKEFSDHETKNKMMIIDRENYWKDKLLEKQLKDGEDSVQAPMVRSPKIQQNPGSAAQRQGNVNP
jgi:hypothetical protein